MQLTTLLAPSLCRASRNNPPKKMKTSKHCLVELLHRSHFCFPVHYVSAIVSTLNSLMHFLCHRNPGSHSKTSDCSSSLRSLVGAGEAEAVLESFHEDFVAFEVHAFFSGKLLLCLNPCSWPRFQEWRECFPLTYWWWLWR